MSEFGIILTEVMVVVGIAVLAIIGFVIIPIEYNTQTAIVGAASGQLMDPQFGGSRMVTTASNNNNIFQWGIVAGIIGLTIFGAMAAYRRQPQSYEVSY